MLRTQAVTPHQITNPTMRVVYLFIIVSFLAVTPSSGRGELLINLDFTAFNNNAPGNVSTILAGSSISNARSVIEAAANYWEAAFANSSSSLSWATNGRITQNVAVTWQNHGGTALATGGTGWLPSGEFGPGFATLNCRAGAHFRQDGVAR